MCRSGKQFYNENTRFCSEIATRVNLKLDFLGRPGVPKFTYSRPIVDELVRIVTNGVQNSSKGARRLLKATPTAQKWTEIEQHDFKNEDMGTFFQLLWGDVFALKGGPSSKVYPIYPIYLPYIQYILYIRCIQYIL